MEIGIHVIFVISDVSAKQKTLAAAAASENDTYVTWLTEIKFNENVLKTGE